MKEFAVMVKPIDNVVPLHPAPPEADKRSLEKR